MKIAWFDHSGSPGGGQLGLSRYLEAESLFDRQLFMLEDGWLAQQARSHNIPVVIAPREMSDVRRARYLIRAAEATGTTLGVLNSRRMMNLAAATIRRSLPLIAYLREDLHRSNLKGLKRMASLGAILPRMDGFLCNSEWTRSTIPIAFRNRPAEIALPICGVDSILGAPAAAGRHPDEKLRILSLSRLEEWKGVHVLLQALTRLSSRELANLEVTVAGNAHFSDERYESSLKHMVRNHRLPVRFIGHIDDVSPLLRASHVLAHCALRPEPFGQVVVQGLAAGLLTIASDAGGPRHIIESGSTGVLVPPGDAEALSSTLSWSFDETRGSSAMMQRARRAATAYSDARTRAALDDSLVRLSERVR